MWWSDRVMKWSGQQGESAKFGITGCQHATPRIILIHWRKCVHIFSEQLRCGRHIAVVCRITWVLTFEIINYYSEPSRSLILESTFHVYVSYMQLVESRFQFSWSTRSEKTIIYKAVHCVCRTEVINLSIRRDLRCEGYSTGVWCNSYWGNRRWYFRLLVQLNLKMEQSLFFSKLTEHFFQLKVTQRFCAGQIRTVKTSKKKTEKTAILLLFIKFLPLKF